MFMVGLMRKKTSSNTMIKEIIVIYDSCIFRKQLNIQIKKVIENGSQGKNNPPQESV